MFSESRSLTDRAVLEYPLGHPPERMALPSVKAPDPRVIYFDRVGAGDPRIVVADRLKQPAQNRRPLAQQYVRHSPTGLEFGFGGSGPADTALNVLSLVVSPREAFRLHQDFKADVIAKIPREGGVVALGEVRAWIYARYCDELADAAAMDDEKEMRELLADIEQEERVASGEG